MNRSNAHRHFFKAPRSIGESCNALFGWATSAGWGNCYVLSLQYLCVITFPSPSQTSRINQQTERAVRTQLGIRVAYALKHVSKGYREVWERAYQGVNTHPHHTHIHRAQEPQYPSGDGAPVRH